jgi:hypothetical protein
LEDGIVLIASKTKEMKEDNKLNSGSVSHRLSQADQKELQKCEDSPVYFYNKYVRKEGQKELTEDEYKDFVKQVEYQRKTRLKLRKFLKNRPLTPDECYERKGYYNITFNTKER